MSPLKTLALMVLAAPALAGEPKVAVLDVPSMFCSLCPVSIRKALERVPGVFEANADLATKSAAVKYDPDKVRPDELADVVTKAGFPATVRSQ
jgi:mercuric ion binding protein